MLKTALFVSLHFLCIHLSAQSFSSKDSSTSLPEKIDRYLGSATKAYKFNGVALVEKNGNVIFHKAYGWKDVAAQTLNDTSTKFPILSITKAFTAIVLLKLQEQGALSLKDKLTTYFPDYPE